MIEVIDDDEEKKVKHVPYTTPWGKEEMVYYNGHYLVYQCNQEGQIESVKLPGRVSVPLSSLFGAYRPSKIRRRGDGIRMVPVEISRGGK